MAAKQMSIESIRKGLGWSQERLAEELGVHRTSVVHWEGGRNAPNGTARKLLEKLAERAKKKTARKKPR